MSLARSTTWLLVTTMPSLLMRKPEPAPRCTPPPCRGMGNGNGKPCPGRPGASSSPNGAAALTTDVTLMCTTAGDTCSTSAANDGRPVAAPTSATATTGGAAAAWATAGPDSVKRPSAKPHPASARAVAPANVLRTTLLLIPIPSSS